MMVRQHALLQTRVQKVVVKFQDFVKSLRQTFQTSYVLRQKMMHFIQNFEYYMMFEVIEPQWHILDAALKTAKTIDEVLKFHNDFLDTCLKECMLTDHHLVKLITNLMATCVLFHSQTNKLYKAIEAATSLISDPTHTRQARLQAETEITQRTIVAEKYEENIAKFDQIFTSNLRNLISSLQVLSTTEANHHTINLVLRLDYNDFYRNTFGGM
eukprot:TRINITY_DN20221_c0_g1_i1.p2 TRINITY_DN20221_c0_g1~~TRINITY_DN20221_c0_g1_i1.p2  ORF type:complete len:213 (-),score=58.17 TRINITY_DN20221_c0_g1_i1:51-689(-)